MRFQDRKAVDEDWWRDRELIWGVDVARILQIGRRTFHDRRMRGMYQNIRRVQFRKGWRYDMEDVMREAFPLASDDMIAQKTYDYKRQRREDRRKRLLESRKSKELIQNRVQTEADTGSTGQQIQDQQRHENMPAGAQPDPLQDILRVISERQKKRRQERRDKHLT